MQPVLCNRTRKFILFIFSFARMIRFRWYVSVALHHDIYMCIYMRYLFFKYHVALYFLYFNIFIIYFQNSIVYDIFDISIETSANGVFQLLLTVPFRQTIFCLWDSISFFFFNSKSKRKFFSMVYIQSWTFKI